tara:strand:- start:39 stop:713 length:675 start_codon:yes stop_codon:yes gene_type:complete
MPHVPAPVIGKLGINMRIFHFLDEKYGLQAIENKCLKVGRINSFNDPFEFSNYESDNYFARKVIKERRKRANWDYGVLCFSQSYSNPVQWAHYANSHKGLCLEFEVPINDLVKIEYVTTRPDFESFKDSLELSSEAYLKHMLSVKYSHWSYEQEVRKIIKFPERKMGSDLIFEPFSESMKLKRVLIGYRSKLNKKSLRKLTSTTLEHVAPSDIHFEMVIPSENA